MNVEENCVKNIVYRNAEKVFLLEGKNIFLSINENVFFHCVD